MIQWRSCGLPSIFILSALLATVYLLLLQGTGNSPSTWRLPLSGERPGCSLADTQNSTLGFQKLFVVNFANRTDRGDKMSLMGAATGLQFEYLPGVPEDEVKFMPPNLDHPEAAPFIGHVVGSWRAHVNAMRHIVENDIASAIVMEDDLDWDVRIKQQMYDYALTTRALTQPLSSDPTRFADPTFPKVQDTLLMPPFMDINTLPKTQKPKLTPYGDKWDLLWVGHCGMRRPWVAGYQEWVDKSIPLPKGVVMHKDDPTVPAKKNLHWWVDHIYGKYKDDFPEHTRITHHSLDAVCNFAYAVTQAGARKILYELGIRMMNDPFDLMLRDWCQRNRGHGELGGTCLTVLPPLFSHFTQEGDEAKNGGRVFDRTKNIRWSAWVNLPKLLRGETDFEDQWPDD